jgi:putative copper resistance protein D
MAGAAGTVLVCVDGPVGVYAERLFWVHMIQHLALIMIAPALLTWAWPPSPRGRRPGRECALRGAGPAVGLVLYTGVVVLTHLTGFQEVSATHRWARDGELLLYLASGVLYLAPLIRTGPGLPYLGRFLLLGLGMGADTLTGLALMLTARPLAPTYATMHPGWGPDALGDQQAAGAIMWFGGDLLMMLLMILIGVRWSRAEPDMQGLGAWVEGARRRAVLHEADDGAEAIDVDTDERALEAYNAMLASLHGRPSAKDGGRAG